MYIQPALASFTTPANYLDSVTNVNHASGFSIACGGLEHSPAFVTTYLGLGTDRWSARAVP
jgi:hypothetical protein